MSILYIDPGTGSMLISALIALVSVGFFMLKGFIYQKLNVSGGKSAKIDLSKSYGLLFYSEGKQYWYTFKPLLEELDRRSIPATYFTSDLNDPGLTADLPYINAQYIGEGQEAFYILNRITADMMVLTTPGLDVLELKRSKNVKYYCHVTHSTGSIAGYKAYSLDYYDSALLGGVGDVGVIGELEEQRKTPTKEIKIIGHTYMDVYRENLRENDKYKEKLFANDKPVVLVSPTWGNHSLLEKYGKKLLSTLEKSNAFNVIIRAHPQSFVSQKDLMDKLLNDFPANENRIWDRNPDGLHSMLQADLMISDFSGIIFDFVSLFDKPILTMSAQYEKRGREASDLEEDPWDLQMIATFGRTIDEPDIKHLPEIIEESLASADDISENIAKVKHVFDQYPNEAAVRGADFISQKLTEIQAKKEETTPESQERQEVIDGTVLFNEAKSGGIIGTIKETINLLTLPETVLQIGLAFILLITYILAGQAFLPQEGLNQEFLNKLLPYSIFLTISVFLIFIMLMWIRGRGTIRFQKQAEELELKDVLLLALPMAPIIQYIIANQDILSLIHSGKVFLFFLAVSAIFVLLVPLVLSPIISKSLSTTVSMASLFILFNMASFGRTVMALRIGFIYAALLLAIFLLLFYNRKYILLVVTSIFFVTSLGTSFVSSQSQPVESKSPNHTEISDSRIIKYTSEKTPVNTPDVFLLIYESYSNQETMNFYGYDNSEQVQYLIDNDFAIYDGTYAIGSSSLESISRVLEPDYMGSDNEEMRELIAKDAGTVKLFNQLSYATHNAVSDDYMTKGFTPEYDYVFPDTSDAINPDKIIIDAILEGEFRFDADFSTVDYDDYVQSKQNILSESGDKPKFLYTHNNYPGHSQNSGVLRPEETDLHLEGIEIANQEMQADIEAIQSENPDALVIVAGDHGPYLTKNGIALDTYPLDEINRMDIQDRYGAFLAIHWPDRSYEEKYDIQVLQDVIPAVISYMYEDDSLFDQTRMERETSNPFRIGGAVVREGIVEGGVDDGLPLFETTGVRSNLIQKAE